MKINFNQELQTFDGKPIIKQGTKEETLKLIDVAVNALLTPDEKSSGEERFKRYNIALNIHSNSNEADLNVEDVATLKKLIGVTYAPIVVGQAWNMLEKNIAEK